MDCARKDAARRAGSVALVAVASLLASALGCGPHVDVPADAKLATEYPFPDEEQVTRHAIQLAEQSIRKERVEGGRFGRDAHMKAHGCVRGSFTVEQNLPEELRVGLFRVPAAYRAWIRYSAGLPKPLDDGEGNQIRGMALKLTGVPGPKLNADETSTQDFLLVSAPVFPMGAPAEYVKFMEAVLRDEPISYFLGWNPFRWKLGGLLQLKEAIGKDVPSLLAERYFSAVPSRLGPDQAVKYSARPCERVDARMPENPGPEYLREDLAARLANGSACFQFMVQLQKDPVEMPIEDPAVEWEEADSPFVPVAKLEIPVQKFDAPAQMTFCDDLSYSPWHSLTEHQPLGGLNRMRKSMYDEISRFRHAQNGAQRFEPTGYEMF